MVTWVLSSACPSVDARWWVVANYDETGLIDLFWVCLKSHQCNNWDGVCLQPQQSWRFLRLSFDNYFNTIYYEEFLCVLIWQKHWRFYSLHCYLQDSWWCTIYCWCIEQFLDKRWRGSTCTEASDGVMSSTLWHRSIN